jgi:hypothetical protein
MRQLAAKERDTDAIAALDACIRNADAERKFARDDLARHPRNEHGTPSQYLGQPHIHAVVD